MSSQSNSLVHVAYDKLLNAYIPFESASDALLANVVLRETAWTEEVLRVLDAVFCAIYDPAFSRDDLTVKCVADIHLNVGRQRRKARELAAHQAECRLMSSRSSGRPSYDFAGMPAVAFDHTIDILREELDACVCAISEASMYQDDARARLLGEDFRALQELFTNMSLVHPLWTLPARELLGRYVSPGPPDMKLETSIVYLAYMHLRSPIGGARTRQILSIPFWLAQYLNAHFPKLLSVICPAKFCNLRSLVLPVVLSNPQCIDTVFGILAGLHTLGELQMHFVVQSDAEMQAFFARLSSLPSSQTLQFINITLPQFPAAASLPAYLSSLNSLPALSKVQLKLAVRRTPEYLLIGQLSWFRNPDLAMSVDSDGAQFSPLSGSVFLGPRFHKVEEAGPNEFENTIPLLRKIYFHCALFPENEIQSLMEHATSAQEIRVEFTRMLPNASVFLTGLPTPLPSRIKTLIIEVKPGATIRMKRNETVPQWLIAVNQFVSSGRCQSLSELLVIFSSSSRIYDGNPEEKIIGITSDACSSAHLQMIPPLALNAYRRVILRWKAGGSDDA